MDANAIALLDIFEKKMRLEVPMFQRQYVWKQEHQWAPLWEDISRKFVEFIEGRTDAPVHFLGAMVLDQRQTQTGRVERRSVIDGQPCLHGPYACDSPRWSNCRGGPFAPGKPAGRHGGVAERRTIFGSLDDGACVLGAQQRQDRLHPEQAQ